MDNLGGNRKDIITDQSSSEFLVISKVISGDLGPTDAETRILCVSEGSRIRLRAHSIFHGAYHGVG